MQGMPDKASYEQRHCASKSEFGFHLWKLGKVNLSELPCFVLVLSEKWRQTYFLHRIIIAIKWNNK
jgi:hypothetical protein